MLSEKRRFIIAISIHKEIFDKSVGGNGILLCLLLVFQFAAENATDNGGVGRSRKKLKINVDVHPGPRNWFTKHVATSL